MTREELRENFDFVRVYDKVRTLDRPMSGSGAIINRDVRLMNHDLCVRQADYEQQKEYNEIVREQNDMTLRSEGYDPDVTRGADGSLDLQNGVPWYMSQKLTEEKELDESLDPTDDFQDFYEACHYVHLALNQETLDALGKDYEKFHEEASKRDIKAIQEDCMRRAEEAKAREAERRERNRIDWLHDRETSVERNTSLVDEHGYNQDNGYNFDEPDF